jgi:dTDP-4-amino-4,6-dideoxygalactose transaminase
MSKKIPFFEYPRLWIDYKQDYISIIDRVASSGVYILQKELSNFEAKLAKFKSANYSVGVGDATDAIKIFLEAIGLKKGR